MPKQPLKFEGGEDYILEGQSAWITVKNLSVKVKKDDEGVVIDVYPLNHEDCDSIASAWVLYSEAERGE